MKPIPAQPLLQGVVDDVGEVKTLTQALALFELVGMPARNLSPRTRAEYHHDLSDLITDLARQNVTTLAAVSLKHLENYQAAMDRRGYKPSTRSRKSHAIKSFFTFLWRQGATAENVAARLIPPRPQKREPRFLSQEEYQRLLRVCSHNTRDAAIVEVFLQTGMRLAELAGLTLVDVEIPKRINQEPDNTGSACVRRKGGKIETIPLNYKACQALATWLKVRPSVDHDALFVTKFKTAISRRAIQYTISTYMQQASIPNASTHTLRHTMATHHVAHGTDLKTIQETLGHASLDTTTIYVSMAKKAQRKALQEHAL